METRTHCAACAGWKKKLGPTWSSGAKGVIGYGHETGHCWKRWIISGGGGILWKGRVERWSSGTEWRISLPPWIKPWLGWGSMPGYGNMPRVHAWLYM